MQVLDLADVLGRVEDLVEVAVAVGLQVLLRELVSAVPLNRLVSQVRQLERDGLSN